MSHPEGPSVSGEEGGGSLMMGTTSLGVKPNCKDASARFDSVRQGK